MLINTSILALCRQSRQPSAAPTVAATIQQPAPRPQRMPSRTLTVEATCPQRDQVRKVLPFDLRRRAVNRENISKCPNLVGFRA